MKKLILFLSIGTLLYLSSCKNEDHKVTTTTGTDSTSAISVANKNMEAYFKDHDTAYVAQDAVFKNMATNEEYKGRKAIAGMLNYIYHVAFDAHADVNHTIVTDDHAVLEATFKGKQIGNFAGMPATNKDVKVPMCVIYDLNKDGLIKEARIYMQTDVMMQQLR